MRNAFEATYHADDCSSSDNKVYYNAPELMKIRSGILEETVLTHDHALLRRRNSNRLEGYSSLLPIILTP